MSSRTTRAQVLVVRMAIAMLVGFTLVGLAMNGLPNFATFDRILANFGDRLEGPLHFRFILQPIMAGVAAWRDGRHDAAKGRQAFGWAVISDPQVRSVRLYEAMAATATVVLVALAMDAIYQVVVDQTFRPFESVLVALLLGFLPYILLRGPFERLAAWWIGSDDDA